MFGQFAAIDSTLVAGVDDSVGGLPEVQRCGVVHRIHVDRLAWQAGVERVDERLPGRADTGCLNVPRANTTSTLAHESSAADGLGRQLAGAASEPTTIAATASAAKIVDSAARTVRLPFCLPGV